MFRTSLALLCLVAIGSGALFAQTPPYGGYANSQYSSGTSASDYIQSFWLKQGTTDLISNPNTGPSASPWNTFYSAITPANLSPGTQYTLELLMTASYAEYNKAWIDYNNDGAFDNTTEVLNTTPVYAAAGATAQINFTPPSGVGGLLRLRVRCVYATTQFDAYTSYTWGEAEDYLVNLGFAIATTSPLPTAAVGSAYSQVITATNGTVPYTWTLPVTGLPAGITATQTGNNLTLSGNPTTAGTANFNLQCTDSSATPKVATKAFAITVVPPPAAMPFTDNFGTDKGWQMGSTWTRGSATTYSAASPTRSEPGTDATSSTTDNMILGDTIGGDYAASMSATTWAVSPMVNCTTGTNVRVRFQRWLGNSIGSSVYIEVSNNGTTWNNVWNSTPAGGQSTINDTAWTLFSYDISTYANGFATVQVRFGVGPTGATVNTGWCIDDFEIYDAGPVLEVKEGGAGGTVITDNQAVGGLRDFGNVVVSTQSTPLTIAITNNGSSSITFGAFTKTGTNPGDFTYQASAMTNPLPVGQTTTFTIIFFATTTGVKTATLSIPHNAGGVSFEINLQGTAVLAPAGIIDVHLTSVAGPVIAHQASPTSTPRDFGNQDIAAGPTAAITIFVRNTGTGSLTMALPDLAGTWWNQYVVTTTGFTTVLAPGASTTFTVAFDPTVVQNALDAFARIVHNDSTQTSPYEVPVIGNGVAAVTGPSMVVHESTLTGTIIAHNAATTASPRDFGTQLVTGGPTAALSIFIQNSGTTALTLGMPVLGGANANQFVLSTVGFLTSVPAAGSTSFTVAFDPSSAGVKVATITYTHNDTTKTSPFIINVTGTGVTSAGIIGVKVGGAAGTTVTSPVPATGLLDFGSRDISAGASTAVQIYLQNTGTGSMTLGMPTLGGTGATQFVLSTTGFTTTLAAAGNTSFTIAFDPITIGVKVATVSFTHNGSGSGTPFVINVTGTGVNNSPAIAVREGTTSGPTVTSGAAAVTGGGRDLGSIDVAAGATAAAVIVIQNTGTQPLTLGTPTLAGTGATHFALNTTGFTTTVAAAGSTQFSVTFNPSSVGQKDAEIQFTHNDTTKPSPFLVPVKGLGTSATGVLISTVSLPAGDVGKPYTSTTLTATLGTGPYTWSMFGSTLPAGMNLSAAGVLDGTPTGAAGLFPITIRVTDSGGGTNDKTFSLAINGNATLSSGGGGGGSCVASQGQSQGWTYLLALAILASLAVSRRLLRKV